MTPESLPLRSLRSFVEERSYRGFDPYDALNSPLRGVLSGELKYGRIFWTQLCRRSCVNLRPLLMIREGENPKGLGLFLWGYAKLYQMRPDECILEKMTYLADRLRALICEGYAGNCWGYNFDWQSRAFFLPKGTPTVVNSSFIGHALIDAYTVTENRDFLDMAVSIKDFILNDLNRLEEDDAICFSYTPIDTYYVHNANLLGASLLARLSGLMGDDALRDVAVKSLAYSMRHQRADGSWYYAERETSYWIDSFHTGFNLQAVKCFLDSGVGEEYRKQFEKGVAFYAENFFLADGTPKYFHDRVYPIDIHAPAQAVVFFSQMGVKYRALTERVYTWMVDNLWDERGYFCFRKGRFLTNRIPYMRWGQAWAFHALTSYCLMTGNNDE